MKKLISLMLAAVLLLTVLPVMAENNDKALIIYFDYSENIDTNGLDVDAMWWYTFPMIIYTLFDQYDFSGKTIIPFNTHMGSGDGGTYDTIRKLEPKAKVLTGLPVEMRDAENGPAKAVEKWLKSLR